MYVIHVWCKKKIYIYIFVTDSETIIYKVKRIIYNEYFIVFYC